MLLNALVSAPEAVDEVIGKSAYVARSGSVAGTFLYGVAIMAAVIFVFAMLGSLRAAAAARR